jgi:hypothetical protein
MTLKPNGPAAACKAVRCGFDSRRRLFEGLVNLLASARRRTGRPAGFEFVRSEQGVLTDVINLVSSVAEHQTDNLAVTGSNPVPTSTL